MFLNFLSSDSPHVDSLRRKKEAHGNRGGWKNSKKQPPSMRGPFSDVQLVSAIVRTTARMIGRKPPVCTVGASFFSLSLTFPSFYEKPGFGSGGEGGREGASSIPLYPPCPGAAVGVGRAAMEVVSSIHIIVRESVHLWSQEENAEEGGGGLLRLKQS